MAKKTGVPTHAPGVLERRVAQGVAGAWATFMKGLAVQLAHETHPGRIVSKYSAEPSGVGLNLAPLWLNPAPSL